jgi:hypothetical protein
LCAVWREGLGCYKIITENKKGYRFHPAIQEFINAPYALWQRLGIIREEMLKRNYKPKELPNCPLLYTTPEFEKINEWETLDQQIAKLKAKGCKCKI